MLHEIFQVFTGGSTIVPADFRQLPSAKTFSPYCLTESGTVMIFGSLLQDIAASKSTGMTSRKNMAFMLRHPECFRNVLKPPGRTVPMVALRVRVSNQLGPQLCSGPNIQVDRSEIGFNVLEGVLQHDLGAFSTFQICCLPALKNFFTGRFGERRLHEANVSDDLVFVFPRQRKRCDNVALLYSPASTGGSRRRWLR